MKIIAQYNSDWGSQTITSSCQIDTDTLQITDIQEVDVDEERRRPAGVRLR